jgi:hypothetical protein
VTDEALTAQAVETPCTPPCSGFSYPGFGFRFAVSVTEMAKLGPEHYPPHARSCRIAFVVCKEFLACTCIGAIRYGCQRRGCLSTPAH